MEQFMVLPSLGDDGRRFIIMKDEDGKLHWCFVEPSAGVIIEIPPGPDNPYEKYD